MEHIILQIMIELFEKFLEYYETHGIPGLHKTLEDFKQMSDEMIKDVVNTFIASADEAIRNAREERIGDRIKIRQSRVPRELFTVVGPFKYERTYFDTPKGRSYILDDLLGVESYERIDAGVSAELVNAAASNSYGKSADIITEGRVSRQSVRNKVMNTGEVVYVPPIAEKTPEILHIFADEDHVHLKNGKSTILPLITVCEGKRLVSKGRNELIRPFHLHGYGMKAEEFWEYTYALCEQRYDMTQVKKIYLYGDGAAWIKRGFDVFPQAVHILDEFHFIKRRRSLFAGEICVAYAPAICGAIKRNDKKSFDRNVQAMLCSIEEKMPVGRERTQRIKKVKEHACYILTNWEAIQNEKLPGSIGSCTEAMVSHILSERFSRNPMGWSKAGLSKMAMIRVFVLNGGQVSPADVTAWKHKKDKGAVITTLKKYEKIVCQQQEAILKDAKKWRWLETENLISGKRSGTKVLLDALGRTREIS